MQLLPKQTDRGGTSEQTESSKSHTEKRNNAVSAMYPKHWSPAILSSNTKPF